MRKKTEVIETIDTRRKEQKRINELIINKDFSEGSLDYLMSRMQALAFGIVWCEWFLNSSEKPERSEGK